MGLEQTHHSTNDEACSSPWKACDTQRGSHHTSLAHRWMPGLSSNKLTQGMHDDLSAKDYEKDEI